ncbi:hypothetical protein IJG28_02595 [Candidatus Saccharibacteria bacterium]|nr:hypothetical protein [Candidatus Saccharibacteria bacterium]
MDNNTFTILPMSQRFSLEPGETYEGEITIVNPVDATEDFAYKAAVAPYGIKPSEDARSEYDIDLTTESKYTEMSKWIKIEEPTGKIKPNEMKKLKFTITVPETAAGGGQYAAITVASDTESESGDGVAVQNVFEMASIIYGAVNGEIKHEGEILENNVPGFVVSTPVTVSAMISNTGNMHEDAAVIIKVTDFFTGNVILPNEENSGEYSELVMPETTRFVEREVGNLPALGVVKISQKIYYQGTVSEVERDVVICPIWFMALVAVTIAAIVGIIVHIVKKHHRKKMLA